MTANADQIEFWNSDESLHWVDQSERYDGMLAEYIPLLLEAAAISGDARTLDVGCGTGTTTIEAARAAPDGQTLGVDISAPMLAHAREKAARGAVTNVRFEELDAQVGAFEPGARDAVISRFGVMFFADPVAAFANIAGALRTGGRLAFVCWQGLLQNKWMAVPAMAIAAHVPLPDPGGPAQPGPFAFGDADRVRGILTDAGLTDVTIEPVERSVLLGGHGSLDDAMEFLSGTSLKRALLADAPPEVLRPALDSVRAALAPFETPEGVRVGAAAWLVTATR